MKVNYKGFEIDVERGVSMSGWDMLYYSVFHIEDGWELVSSFEDSEETIEDKINDLRFVVNDYLKNPGDYDL